MTGIIAGISPGTRMTGIAIVQDRKIIDVQVREIKNSQRNYLALFTAWISAAIEKYQVRAIAMKIVASSHMTESLQQLYEEIRHIAQNAGISLFVYDTKTIRKHLPGNHKNKDSLLKSLSLEFLDLGLRYHDMTNPRNIRIWEAVACAVHIAA